MNHKNRFQVARRAACRVSALLFLLRGDACSLLSGPHGGYGHPTDKPKFMCIIDYITGFDSSFENAIVWN